MQECVGTRTESVVVSQVGCEIRFSVSEVGSFRASVASSQSALAGTLTAECGGDTTGNFRLLGLRSMVAEYGFAPLCCGHGTVTLTR